MLHARGLPEVMQVKRQPRLQLLPQPIEGARLGLLEALQSRLRSIGNGVVLWRMFAVAPSGLYIGMTITVSASRIRRASALPLLPRYLKICSTASVL